MQKQTFIQITENFIQSFASLNNSEQKRVIKMAQFQVPSSLNPNYKEYKNYCQAFINALPVQIKQAFAPTSASMDGIQAPSGLDEQSSNLFQADNQEQSQPQAQAQDTSSSQEQNSGLPLTYQDKRFIVSFVKAFPFRFQKVMTDNFVSTAFKALAQNKVYFLPFSLRSFLQNSNLDYKIKDPSKASFTLEIKNPISQITKDFSFLTSNQSSYQEEIQNLNEFLSQNQIIEADLDLAMEIVNQILDQQIQGVSRSNQRNQLYINQNLYQVEVNQQEYFLKQINLIGQNVSNQFVFNQAQDLSQKVNQLALNTNSPNQDLSQDLEQSSIQAEALNQERTQAQNTDIPVSQRLTPSSLSSTQTGIQSQSQTQAQTQTQTQSQSSGSPSGLQLASSMLPGVRRMPFAQMPTQPGATSQNPSRSIGAKLSNFYKNNRRAIPPAIGSISGLIYVIMGS